MQFKSLPTSASSLQERFLFPVLSSRLFFKSPKQLVVSHHPQTCTQWSYQCQELFLLLSLELLSSHSSYHIEPCAFVLSQSNSMLSPFNESPWRLQAVSSFQLLWSCELLPGIRSDSKSPDEGLDSQALLDSAGVVLW